MSRAIQAGIINTELEQIKHYQPLEDVARTQNPGQKRDFFANARKLDFFGDRPVRRFIKEANAEGCLMLNLLSETACDYTNTFK
jgi:hypothetical protein